MMNIKAVRFPSCVLAAIVLLTFSASGSAELQANWTQKNDALRWPMGPWSRTWFQMAYDSLRNQTVAYNGASGGYRNDMWHYDSSADTWVEVEPNIPCPLDDFTPPLPTDEHQFAYDSYNDLYWTFGGSRTKCDFGPVRTAQSGTTTSVLVDDTIEATEPDFYKDWTVRLVRIVNSALIPTGGQAYVDSYDPDSKTLTLATPISGLAEGIGYQLYPQRLHGTFYYDPNTGEWTGFNGPHWNYSGPLPNNRLSAGFAFSPVDRAIVMFGGTSNNDTWIMDVENFTWVQMIPNGDPASPPRRREIGNAMVYDSRNDVFILFGGECRDGGYGNGCEHGKKLDDTWVYKLSTNTWTRMNPAIKPPPRWQHQMVYDEKNDVTVMFGGEGESTIYSDLWSYHYRTNTWTELTPESSPVGRKIGSMAYDADKELTVLYGGVSADTGRSTREIWALSLFDDSVTGRAPVASPTVDPPSGDTTTSFAFDAAASYDLDGEIVSYLWNFDDGTTSTSTMSTHLFAFPNDYNVTLTVTDNDGNESTANLNVSVLPIPGNEFIVDDLDAETRRTGTWLTSSALNPFDGHSFYSNVGDTFTWEPSLSSAGSYEVYAWWTYHSNRSTTVPYRITHDGGTATVTVNQHDPALAGQWNLLGTFNLTPAVNGEVTVSSEYGQANADAVRLVRIGPPGNRAPMAVLDVTPLSGNMPLTVDFDASGSSDPDDDSLSYAWDFGDGTSASGVTVSHVYTGASVFTVVLTVTDEHGAIGIDSTTIDVSPEPGTETIVDNLDPNTSQNGSWVASSGLDPYAGHSVYSDGGATFTWEPMLSVAASYDVYAWWTYHSNRSTTVPYRITHDGGTATVTVNQHDPALAGQWNLLGRFALNPGANGEVTVSSENGQANADAVRYIRVD